MHASETQLTKFLNSNQQLIIPIYQRTYSWGFEQCDRLWKDLMLIVKNNTNYHFLGSLVYVSDGLYNNVETQKYLVIDGQQRITTISLIFLAMFDYLGKNNNYTIKQEQIKNQFLVNEYASDGNKIKLCLTQDDKEVFDKIVDGIIINDKDKKTNIYKNYLFFLDKFEKSDTKIEEVYSAMLKIIVVAVVLDKNNDNPQLIFESLNSTGLDLSQFDLIRNYILMSFGSDDQKDVYNNYWLPMEKIFTESYNIEKFDYFIRSYLIMKLGSIPKVDRIYEEFKKYLFGKDARDVIKDVLKYAIYYSKIDFDKEEDKDILCIFEDIKSLKVEVSHPFILAIYNDYVNERILKSDLILILKDVESYVFRRAICGIPTNSLNKTFANLYREIDKNNYLESFRVALLTKETYNRFPNDAEFKEELSCRDLYSFRSKMYLFSKIEYLDNKERVNLENLTIEHIMPQELSNNWKISLGSNFKEIHEKYLHTLGNLTLTGYNPDMSNKDFVTKRDMDKGFRSSGLKLNKFLSTLNAWNENEIRNRANLLIKDILEIWKYPNVDESIVNQYKQNFSDSNSRYKIDDFEYLEDDVLDLFNELKERILSLDNNIKEEIKKLYIAYKLKTNFVDIVPQKSGLRLSLNMKFREINDPENHCRDVSNLGRWGNGDIEFKVSNVGDIDYAIFLITQSINKQK